MSSSARVVKRAQSRYARLTHRAGRALLNTPHHPAHRSKRFQHLDDLGSATLRNLIDRGAWVKQ